MRRRESDLHSKDIVGTKPDMDGDTANDPNQNTNDKDDIA